MLTPDCPGAFFKQYSMIARAWPHAKCSAMDKRSGGQHRGVKYNKAEHARVCESAGVTSFDSHTVRPSRLSANKRQERTPGPRTRHGAPDEARGPGPGTVPRTRHGAQDPPPRALDEARCPGSGTVPRTRHGAQDPARCPGRPRDRSEAQCPGPCTVVDPQVVLNFDTGQLQ